MQIVGYVNSWTQPISTRVMMQDTGIQTPVGIKVKGKDLATVAADRAAGRGAAARLPGHAVGDRGADLAGLLRRRPARSRADGASTASRWTKRCSTVRFAIGGDNVIGIRQADKTIVPLADSVLARVHRHAGQGAQHAGRHRRRARRCRWATIADVAVREAPEMIRNDNGELAGYIYVYLRDITGAGVRRARARVPADAT